MFLHLLSASLAVFFNLHRSKPLLLIYDLILHAILLLNLKVLELLFLFVLLFDYLGLFGFFALGLEDSLLHLPLLILSLLVDGEVALCDHLLILVCHLVLVDFLQQQKHLVGLPP